MYEGMELLRRMILVRRFEELVSRLYANSEIPGFVHLYLGQEASGCGVCSCLDDDDFITSTHRGHGHLIAKGGDVKLMMAELFAKKTGYCKGKGGSMHIADLELGILGANGIVGGGIPIAVGAGYGAKVRGTRQVSVSFFGDGATNEGVFSESLNAASAWNLPVIFVCENNEFGVSTRFSRISKESDITKRAAGYGMPAVAVDGNDVSAVQSAAAEAVARARQGGGPTLLVNRTFRYHGHFEGENVMYWNEGELDEWKAKDPLVRYESVLRTQESSDADIAAMKSEIEALLEEAVQFARDSDYPAPEDALTDLFAAN